MASARKYEPTGPLSRAVNGFEETAIAVLLGLMTIITFINVPVRYLFDGILLPKLEFLWAVEMTGFLFAWLVIFGVSYTVKTSANLGIDVIVNLLPPALRRLMGLVCGAICIVYAALLLKSGWDIWAPFANLPPTTGRWFPTGFDSGALQKGWYEVNDTPLPEFLRFMEAMFNEGEEYEKLPRLIPYLILPFGFALMLLRFVQATIRLWRGEIETLIASHEVEEMVEDAAKTAGGR